MKLMVAQPRKRLSTLYLHCTMPCKRVGKKAPGAPCRAVIFAALAAWLGTAINAAATDSESGRAELMERGAYLATIADCTGCHTAGQDHPRFAGGLPIKSPFGVIYSTNITPDTETGIGRYSYEDFAQALREGIAKHGKRLYPAMPYPSFTAMSDGDVRALYAFFMHGVKPVRHTPPRTSLPFPFNQRWTLQLWNMAFVNHTRFEPHPERDAQWNRGAYLVQALAHCGACHTPRGLAYQEKGYSESSSHYLTGALIENWYAGDLTGNPATGLGRWSEADISTFLKTGHSSQSVAFGSMVTVVENSTQYLRKEDLGAIAHYLKSLSASEERASYRSVAQAEILPAGFAGVAPEPPGAGIYSGYCSKCHRHDGSGKPARIPPLAGGSMVLSGNVTSLIRLMLEGGIGPRTEKGPVPERMPGYAKKLTDREIADVLTFVRNSWGNKAFPVVPRDVALLRKKLDE